LPNNYMKTVCAVTFFILIALFSTGCERHKEPVKVGFIGCLTGRSIGLGAAGRDGFLLAVEEVNAAGGLSGHQLEPIIVDTGLDPEKAKRAASKLVAEQVAFAVGPMTSQIAVSIVPIMNDAKIPLVSPTVSTNKLIGIDDYFFRVYYANSQAAAAMAGHVSNLGLEKIAVLYDVENRAYTEDWLRVFSEDFADDRHSVIPVPFKTASAVLFYELVKSLLDDSPDGLLILANSIDTALICQQAAKLDLNIPKYATGWSFSGKLITYGGDSVEGLTVVQSVDFHKKRKEVGHFLKAHRTRFFDDPTFPAAHAYDATHLALRALKKKLQGEDMKKAMLGIHDFPGVLQDFSLDQYGDVVNPPIFFRKIDRSVFESL